MEVKVLPTERSFWTWALVGELLVSDESLALSPIFVHIQGSLWEHDNKIDQKV